MREHDAPRARKVGLELEDVRNRRAAELVDGLVVVADHREVVERGGKELDDFVLRKIRVLKLVHQDVRKPPAQFAEHARPLAEQLQHVQHQVAEIERVALEQNGLIGLIGVRELVEPRKFGGRFIIRCRRVEIGALFLGKFKIHIRIDGAIFCARKMREKRPDVFSRIAKRPEIIEFKAGELLAGEQPGVQFGCELEVAREADLDPIFAQHLFAKRMKRGDLNVDVSVRQQQVDALLHLARGLIRKRESQNLLRFREPLLNEPRDAPRDGRGFSGSGTGHNQKRACGMGYGLRLLLI